MFVAPTEEMRRWAARLHGWLGPSVAGTALVTPIAHVANNSLGFQAYLYSIFHRTWPAKLGHVVLMPLIAVATLATAGTLHPALCVAAGVALVVWYARVAGAHRLPLLAGVLAASGAAFTFAALAWSARWSDLGVWAHPALVWAALGLAQTLSHLTEPDVPPRVSGCDDWVPLPEYFRRDPVRNGLRALAMVFAGTMNEMWSGWRLYPVVALDLLWAFGYAPAQRARHEALVARAVEGGNPAIDFIGRGGGRPVAYTSAA